MKNLRILLLAVLMTHPACIQIPEIEEPQVPPKPQPCPGEDASNPVAFFIDWELPMEGAQVGATVRIQPRFTAALPESVELLVDGKSVATLVPPFVLDWETLAVSEGPHRLSMIARRCDEYALSPPREITVDRIGPTLIAQTPADGSQWVSVHQVIQAELSEPVLANSVNSQTVRLLSGETEIQVDVSLSQTGKVLTLRPSAPLPVNGLMRVVIDSAITDAAGNPLALPAEGWSWRVPAVLPLGTPRAAHPTHSDVEAFSLQLDSAGNPLVAWVEADATGVHVERWNGAIWQALGNPLKGAAGDPNATDCVLQLDSAAIPLVTWIQPKADGSREVQVRLWDGSAWMPWGPTIAPLLAQSSLSELQMRIWGTTPVVAFKELNASTVRATVMRLDAGEWKSQGGFDYPSDKRLVSMQMELNRWGDQFLIWNERAVAPGWTTHVGKWQGVGRQSSYPYPSIGVASPILASTLLGDTNVVVANPVSEGDAQSVRVQQWTAQGEWADIGPSLSSIPGKTNASASALKFDPQGRLVVLIEEPETEIQPSVRSLFVQRWETDHWAPVGGALSANPGATSVLDSQLAVDKDGRIFLAWTEVDEQDPTQSRLHVYRPND
ncbi:Ig-like domain-containing protein [Corallococcus sp. bb12-1]|uniref:Ig-like domain-containing protein n=1 Tax=Corallococcus sp. bb12-1 TaxID=2996784 RepID=UPI0022711535|nr:Ig-like domain-containing protein [Corallococcus sp. bb12-1]MCY1046585.1 Ig-like domain-containing protein [Corallococcus sp. bb12-1]